MNEEEAKKILETCSGYINDGVMPGELTLDGYFTLEELEALLVLARSKS